MSADLFTRMRHRLSEHGEVRNFELIQRPEYGGYTLQFEFKKDGTADFKLFRKHAGLRHRPEAVAKSMYQQMMADGHIDPLPTLTVVTLDPMP